MCMSFKLAGLYAIIPTTLLLAVSFFVLLTVNNAKSQGVKIFGYVIAVLLWISAAIVFSGGIYSLTTGKYPMKHMMKKMQGHHMQQPTTQHQTKR